MRILLVEDDPRLARSYRRNLEDEGHQVEVAGDAEGAYEHLCAAPDTIDVVILDVLLPGRNGIALCRDLRRDGMTTPILLLTALDQTEDKVAGLDAGADDYLTKPFPMDELLARVRALGRRSSRFDPNATETRLRIGDMVMDLARHEVTRGGLSIHLTVREFALLEMLARHPNRVLTREQLTDHIWPDGTEAGSNVLDTYIHFLRDKLDRNGDHKLIHTVRGVGYILRAPVAPETRP
jgi:DNA-binding response OmpR family regulator